MSRKKDAGATPSTASAKAARKPAKPGSLISKAAEEVRLTRRLLVSFLLAAGSAPALAQDVRTAVNAKNIKVPDTSRLQVISPEAFKLADNITEFTLIRPRDLVVLNIRLVNAHIKGSGKNRKIHRNGTPAIMVVEHQPQAIMESTWPDTLGQNMPAVDTFENVDPTPAPETTIAVSKADTARAYIAGPSRLAYIMPTGVNAIDFTAKAVLDACATWPLNLDLRAGSVPAALTELHAFDPIRDRLSVIADQQKLALQKYGPGVEALLKRAANKVAEAIATSADSGVALPDDVIDALIDFEIKATLDPKQLTPLEAAQLQPTKSRSGKPMKLYVATLATRKLATRQRTDTDVLTGTIALVDQTEDRKPLDNGAINPNATDIEIPFRLHMTPLATAGFSHARAEVNHGSPFTELWHTRMGTRVGDWVLSDTPQPLRAVHADDKSGAGAFCLADTSPCPEWPLTSSDRRDLVALMSAPKALDGTKRTPLPATARHLRLTALGGSMDAEGLWSDSLKLDSDLVAWKHVTSIGRDQFVRVVYDGYLFPFGHAASLIKVSERKFAGQKDGGRVAALLQKYYIIVRQRLRTFPGDRQRHMGRDFPFTRVEITTKQTVDMKAPVAIVELGAGYYAPDKAFQTFWPERMDNGGDILFHMIFSDAAGRQTVADMPLIFMSGTRNAKPVDVNTVVAYYNDDAPSIGTRRELALGRQLIRLTPAIDADGTPLAPGESDYHTSKLVFRASTADVKPAETKPDGAFFYPGIKSANIEVPALKNLLGHAANPTISYHQSFLENGLGGANPADVVFDFPKLSVPSVKDEPTDKFGGLLSPGLKPDGLSRKLGVLTDVASYTQGDTLPLGALDGLKLLGVVDVKDILLDALSLSGAATGVPQMKTVTSGTSIITTYELSQAKVKTPDAGGVFVAKAYTGGGPQLLVRSTLVVAKAGQAPQATVEAALKAFKINLFGFIILNFKSLSLTVKPGSKPEVDPIFEPGTGVMFGGPLEFLNGFRSLIPMDGFSDPPGLDVGPGGISASYSLGLPDIAVGALTLQNVNLGAGFDLPFNGDGPTARFNFAERHNPFNLTVSMLGGGGFFAICIGSGGVRELEASLEFGAQVAINLGVASGGVYVKAGFYFHWIGEPVDKQMISFEGFIELGGHLSVLGLITVSLTFHLGLTYEKTPGNTRLYGTATLTVEIDILFFSISQDISVERQFAGSSADPLFLDFVPKKQMWSDYCSAFA
ncbi:hypothetical protein [Asticcacaulis sp. AC402]|uniref:hypothetical protein n=1 Tax=Asticcacaulis sp. AC402 TaxID=1282361 RepID=UPI0003C3F717|nr:hypothetical protein [Asticcacaulis sp. AC402]ESQ74714.1 hypothetical protein ABAC402_12475 [Asticcacaulis sp. AC402]